MTDTKGQRRDDVPGFKNGENRLQAKEYKEPLESGKAKQTNSPLDPVQPRF